MGGMKRPEPRTSLTRVRRFRARHHYGRAGWSEARNREVFGAQVQSHEHAFRVEVTVSGVPDAETGFLVDLPLLDALLDELLGPLEGGDLNQRIPEVRTGELQPSTEALSGWIWIRLENRIPEPARLERVRVWESDELGSTTERADPR